MTMYSSLIHFLETHMGSCFYMKYFGIPCPGCGMQRSFIELLKGHWLESLQLYPALIPTFIMVIYLILHMIFKFRQGGDILKYSFILNAAIIVFHYIYILITLKP
jgi:hypothetical protein